VEDENELNEAEDKIIDLQMHLSMSRACTAELRVEVQRLESLNNFDAKRLKRLATICGFAYGNESDEFVLGVAGSILGEICQQIERVFKSNQELRDVVGQANDYLNTNRLTNIAHGSILHQKLEEAVRP